MFVCCEYCVLSGRGLCDKLITHPEESYRLWCVVVCDLETSRMRRPWPALGRSATGKKNCWLIYLMFKTAKTTACPLEPILRQFSPVQSTLSHVIYFKNHNLTVSIPLRLGLLVGILPSESSPPPPKPPSSSSSSSPSVSQAVRSIFQSQ